MYSVEFSDSIPELEGRWNGPVWDRAETVSIGHSRNEGTDHCPLTQARLLYSSLGISGIFSVDDRYVKCVNNGYMGQVYKDSCVEFFVRPYKSKGYFNFEFNCGGNVICSYITDHRRIPGGFMESVALSIDDLERISVFHSMPEIIEDEITEPVRWFLEFFIPFDLLKKYTGIADNLSGQIWTANFQKCGDETSHPHWISWQPLPELNFHLPDFFGEIVFKKNVDHFSI